MKVIMKKMVSTLLFVLVSSSVFAELHTGVGLVHTIGMNHNEVWGENSDYILVEGFNNSDINNACTSSYGMVIARIPEGEDGDRMLSVAMAAKLASSEVVLIVDTELKEPVKNSCYIRTLRLN